MNDDLRHCNTESVAIILKSSEHITDRVPLVSARKEICSISSRSRVLAHRPCPKLEMFCPSVLQLFYGCSKVLMTNHGMCFLFLFLCFSNRLEIRAQLP